MIDLKSIEKVGNGLFGLTDESQEGYKRLRAWLELDSTTQYIDICDKNSIGRKMAIEKTGKNRYAKTWGNLHVAIAFAMWLSPEFKYAVIDVFINKKILDFRLLGIDYNKQLNVLLDALEKRSKIQNELIFLIEKSYIKSYNDLLNYFTKL